MSGFYGIIAPGKKVLNEVTSYFYSGKLDHIINESFTSDQLVYGRSVINRFGDDRSVYENDRYIVLFEGIYFNRSNLTIQESIIEWYKQDPDGFTKNIDGVFSGFIFDKDKNKIIIFNDHLASRSVYLYHNPENKIFVFASELKVVAKILEQIDVSKNINIEAIKYFLSVGYYPYDNTPISEVRRMKYATLTSLSLDTFQLSTTQYFSYSNDVQIKVDKGEIIENLNELIVSAIKKEWDKDVKYSYDHYALLSGGLDSRVNVMLADRLGFSPINTITFAESDVDDAVIPQKIANDKKLVHSFFPLDGGNYLVDNPINYILANDGMVNYTGSAHGMSVLKFLSGENCGLLHSGQIGDLLFGSHSAQCADIKKMILKNVSHGATHLADQSQIMQNVISDYQAKGYEVFAYEQKAINGALNGDRSLSHYIDIISPFYDINLIKYCLSIPDKYKKHEGIYIDWINQLHPYLSKYKWEKAGVRPTSVKRVIVGHTIKRALNHFRNKIGFTPISMNPMEKWTKRNSLIYSGLDKVYEENKEIGLNLIPDLDLEKMYWESQDIQLKFKIITLLVSLDLHFT